MRGIGFSTCSECRRKFSGQSTWDKHRIGSGENRRCRTVKELRRNGLVQRPDGIWTRPNPVTTCRQLRLFPLRGRPRNRRGWGPRSRGHRGGQQARYPNPALFPGSLGVAA